MMTSLIDNFDEEYYFLSNFTYSPFVLGGKRHDTVEHYFQSMKTLDLKFREKIRTCGHPRFAKRFGRQVHLRDDWEQIKFSVMKSAVTAKFDQNDGFAERLRDTHPSMLVEGNTWHDNIWGDCKCQRCKSIEGQNLLGKILMDLRENYLNKR